MRAMLFSRAVLSLCLTLTGRPGQAGAMTPPPGRRAENRAHYESEILRLGRAQLAEVGAAGLSLRAIARELGVSSSAVYRYVASRDELLTRLIIESFDALADAAEAAHRDIPSADLHARFHAVGHAMRNWALAHPHDWALLYGSPVPGYVAPADQTNPPGTRVARLLIGILGHVVARRKLPPAARRLTPGTAAIDSARTMLADLGELGEAIPPEHFLAGLDAWALLIAAISREVFEQIGPIPGDPRDLFEATLARADAMVIR